MDLRDFGRALVWTVASGPDPAPTLLPRRFARWHRQARLAVVATAFVIALTALANARIDGWWAQVVGTASAIPLGLLVYRPLLAWRLSWVLGLVGLTVPSHEASWHWEPVQVMAFLVVLFVVGTCQPPTVLCWVWAFSVALAWPNTASGNQIGVVVFFTVLLVVGDQVRRRQRAQRELAVEEERSAVLAERWSGRASVR